jgi:hypothetical protein
MAQKPSSLIFFNTLVIFQIGSHALLPAPASDCNTPSSLTPTHSPVTKITDVQNLTWLIC